VLIGQGGRAQAAGTTCKTTAGGSGAAVYSVTVCIEAPADGAALSGPAAVSGTVAATGQSPGVQRLVFSLDGQYLLTDYQADGTGRYTFTLRTQRFVDGAHTLSAQALMRDGLTTDGAAIGVTFGNGVTQPPVNGNTFTPAPGTQPAAGAPFVLAAAGDGAGGETSETNVVNLIGSWNPNLFLYLGDVYEKGTRTEFDNWYGDAGAQGLYGRFRAITDPTVGNHEYVAGVAPGYFGYWDNAPPYYSVDTHGWHIVSLDSNSELGQTGPGSPQYDWLAADLAADTQPCTAVFFHHPRFNIGQEGSATRMDQVWALLAQRGVDIVLTGHDHTYQRWQPMDSSGAVTPAGPTQFVVGTGGHALQTFVQSDPRVAAAFSKEFGALRLELNPAGAAFRFVNVNGVTLDSGSVGCHGAPAANPDLQPPSAPAGLQAAAQSRTRVLLTWSPALDNVGVTGYDVFRDGVLIAHAGPDTTYADTTASPGTTYHYTVAARDAEQNDSAPSNQATVTTNALTVLFSDDFETEAGGLSPALWTSTSPLSVQGQQVFSGALAARAANGSPAFADHPLPAGLSDLYYRIRFKVISQAAGSTVNLMTFCGSSCSSANQLLSVYVSSSGKLYERNEVSNAVTQSTVAVAPNVWHTLQTRLVAAGASSQVTVWLDGVTVPALSVGQGLGTAAQIGLVELGDSASGHTFDAAFDEVAVDPNRIVDETAPTSPTNLAATAVSGLEIDLAWNPATDDTGVAGYDVYRDCAPGGPDPCAPLATGITGTTFADTGVSPLSSHFYVVVTRDAEGNASLPSNVASAETPVVFSDDFETGGLSRWTVVSGLTVQSANVGGGVFAARATSAGGAGQYAYKTLGAGLGELYARIRFEVLSRGSSQITLARLSTGTGTPLLTIGLSPTGRLTGQVAGGSITTSGTPVATGVWNEVQVHLLVGSPGRSDVWLNGSVVPELSAAGSFGTTPAARLQIGDDASTGHVFDIAFDDVLVDTAFIVDTEAPSAPTGLAAAAESPFAVDLSWTAAVDNVAVASYDVYRDGTLIATIGPATSYRDATAKPGTTYAYALRAADAGGNVSALSIPATVTLPVVPTGPDTVAPTPPAALVARAVSATRIDLGWQASSDNVAVTGYTVSRGGTVIASLPVSGTSYSDTSVAPATAYSYTVSAVDAAGNRSAPSAPAGATTPAAPKPPVVRPKPLAMRLLAKVPAARPAARLRIRYSIGVRARVSISVLRGKKRVSLVRQTAKRGGNSLLLRVPRRAGRYTLLVAAHPTGYVLKQVRAPLVVRVPKKTR